jgi:exodeoxyribonuclease V gamma subunit
MIPPSALVSELMDYIEQGFEIPGKNILEQITRTHRLQAFSPEYFKDKQNLFSYSKENFEAAQSMLRSQPAPAPFITQGLSDPEETWKTVELGDLCRFFGNPIRFLVQKRLGIYLEEGDPLLEERESFELKGLEKYLLEQRLVKETLEGHDLRQHLTLTRASGQLPHGTPGECVFEKLSRGAEHFAEKIKRCVKSTRLAPVDVDVHMGDFRLTGRLEMVYPEQLIQYRYARVTPTDRIKIWINHLALNSSIADNYPRTSMLMGLAPHNTGEPVWTAWEYPPVKNSEEILATLVEMYWFGLKMPLHFFPKSSWSYSVMRIERNTPQGDALQTAHNTWNGNDYARGECEDAYYQLCFRNTDPLDSQFEKTAMDIFKPLLAHQKEIQK